MRTCLHIYQLIAEKKTIEIREYAVIVDITNTLLSNKNANTNLDSLDLNISILSTDV